VASIVITKIHYTRFPVAGLQQVRNTNKSVVSLQQVGDFPIYGEVAGKRV